MLSNACKTLESHSAFRTYISIMIHTYEQFQFFVLKTLELCTKMSYESSCKKKVQPQKGFGPIVSADLRMILATQLSLLLHNGTF